MNERQAGELLAKFAVVFHVAVTKDLTRVWFESVLQRTDADVGFAAAERIVVEDQRFPTPARFAEVLRAVKRGREPFAAIDTGSGVEPVRGVELVAEARSKIPVPAVGEVPADLAERVSERVARQSACVHEYRFDHDNGGRRVDRCVLCGHWLEHERGVARIDPATAVSDR